MLILILLLLQTASGAQEGPVPLFEKDAAGRFQLRPDAADVARTQVVNVSGRQFSKALRVQVTRKPDRSSPVQVSAPVDAALERGDVLLATFWIRAVETADPARQASVDISLRASGPQPRVALSMPADAGKTWKKVQYPFSLLRTSYAKGQAELAFSFGTQVQTVEIGGVELVNYGKTRRVSDLPVTPLGYAGREPNAPWRKAARARIEQLRKGSLTVIVKDNAGKPVRNAAVAVKMRKHAFGFGTAVSGPLLSGARAAPEDVQKYREHILRLFNKAVMENDLKWPQWNVVANRPATLGHVDWLRQNGIPVRGHNLVWPAWRWLPKEPAALKDDPPALAKFVIDHVEQAAGALRGKVVEWDVINEPFSNHDLMDILGKESMVEWFKAARRADPDVKLFINDYSILAGNDTAHQNHYYETIQYLIEQGAPLEGIGMQGHFPARPTPPEEVLKRLNRFAKFGKDIEVTEFDIETDEVTQADYTRDFMLATFSHPSITGFLMWGFWENSHWRPSAAMIRGDWTTKPNFNAYHDLVFKEWWTDVTGKTGSKGTYSVRGFLGDYEIEVRAAGRTKTLKATLPKQGTTVVVNGSA